GDKVADPHIIVWASSHNAQLGDVAHAVEIALKTVHLAWRARCRETLGACPMQAMVAAKDDRDRSVPI
ncbi:hypothetical protein, partial [Nocardia fluminea]|uniref:hypothetical protein n=1 Tax=Nocardia fluminea TaxID=134984 RepID=UPI0033E990C2